VVLLKPVSFTSEEWAPRPGIPELVARLQARGADVFLVSGGFRAIIDPIADLLGIPLDHVHANTILFEVGCMAPHSLHAYTLRRFLHPP
jgi:phosphoserine phosphatase